MQQLFDLRGDLRGSYLLEHDAESALKILQLWRRQAGVFASRQNALDAAAVALGVHGVEQICHLFPYALGYEAFCCA